MGARAQEAVSFRSQLKDVDLLRLLGVLAAGADDDTGLIDPAPGRETLAGIFNCSERTITNRVARLVESGELEIVRIGSGPGRPSAYRLLLSIPDVTCFNDERGKKGEKSGTLEARVTALEGAVAEIKGEIEAKFFTLLQAIEELKEEIASLKGEKGGKGESEREKGGSLKGESLPEVERVRSVFDPSFDPEEKNTPPTPPPDSPFPFKPARHNRDVTPADARVAMILRVCDLDVTVPDHVRQAERAAAQLAHYSAEIIWARYARPSPGVVPEGWNWFSDDWRGKRGDVPRPSQVIETISLTRQVLTVPTPQPARQTMSRAEAGALEVALEVAQQLQWSDER